MLFAVKYRTPVFQHDGAAADLAVGGEEAGHAVVVLRAIHGRGGVREDVIGALVLRHADGVDAENVVNDVLARTGVDLIAGSAVHTVVAGADVDEVATGEVLNEVLAVACLAAATC